MIRLNSTKPWLSVKLLCIIHFVLAVFFAGMLLFTKYGTSVVLLTYVALILVIFRDKIAEFGWRSWLDQLSRINPALLSLVVIFFITLIGLWNSENASHWLSRFRIRLPLLAMPVIFYYLPSEVKFWKPYILKCILAICVGYTFGVLINSWWDHTFFIQRVVAGSSIQTPMQDHVRFAQFIGMMSIVGLWEGIRLKDSFITVGSVLLAVALHFIAVRSGLLILYIGLVSIYLLKWREISWHIKGLVFISLILFPIIAVQNIESLKSKWYYTKWDMSQLKAGNVSDYSDGGRFVSYMVGWDIFKKNPLFGVGPGDMDDVVKERFRTQFPEVKEAKQPHNQFLHTAASSGIIGLLIFSFVLFWSINYAFQKHNYGLFLIIICSICAFMVEASLETARATAMIAYFWSFWAKD